MTPEQLASRENALGIVALRNHLPEIMRRYRLMQEAMKYAFDWIGAAKYDGLEATDNIVVKDRGPFDNDVHEFIRSAIAESEKPLEAKL